MAKGKRPLVSEDDQATRRIPAGNHVHTAEIHGESETQNLRPWAKRAVLKGR